MILLLRSLAILSLGCAGYVFTLPTDCFARELRDFTSSEPTYRGCVCQPIGASGYFACRCYVGPYPISCECFDAESPPPGQVWMRRMP